MSDGCEQSEDCAGDSNGEVCDTSTSECVECVVDGDCEAGSVCGSARSCVPGCSASHGCPGALTCCVPECVDSSSDPANCGGCGAQCHVENGTPACEGGSCRVSACDPGFDNCNNRDEDGCEAVLAADAEHCGECGHNCFGGLCVDGICTPAIIASEQPFPRGIAVDDRFVYWTNQVGGEVMRVSLTGGDPIPVSSSEPEAWEIAINATHVFWTRWANSSGVARAPKTGGAVARLVTGVTNTTGIASANGRIYWAARNDGEIWSMNPDGSDKQLLTSSVAAPEVLAPDDAFVYFTQGVGPPARVPVGGGTATNVSTDAAFRAEMIAVRATDVYLLRTQRLYRVPSTGGMPAPVTPDGFVVEAFTVNDEGIWLVGPEIARLPFSGGTPSVLYDSYEGSAFRVAVDATSLYWTDDSGGLVYRLAK